jgi:hypothetical protein
VNSSERSLVDEADRLLDLVLRALDTKNYELAYRRVLAAQQQLGAILSVQPPDRREG